MDLGQVLSLNRSKNDIISCFRFLQRSSSDDDVEGLFEWILGLLIQ